MLSIQPADFFLACSEDMPSIVLGARDIKVLQYGEGEMIREISVIRLIVATLKKKKEKQRKRRWWFLPNTG